MGWPWGFGTNPSPTHWRRPLRVHIALVAAHIEAVALGTVSKETLAWMLDVNPEEIDVHPPQPAGVNLDDLEPNLALAARAGTIAF